MVRARYRGPLESLSTDDWDSFFTTFFLPLPLRSRCNTLRGADSAPARSAQSGSVPCSVPASPFRLQLMPTPALIPMSANKSMGNRIPLATFCTISYRLVAKQRYESVSFWGFSFSSAC
ncbi:unnamed protein product (mitochondrion) [Musa textilis]